MKLPSAPTSTEDAGTPVVVQIQHMAGVAARFARSAATPRRTVSEAIDTASTLARLGCADPKHPAPESPVNVPIGAQRRVAFAEVHLSDVRAVKDTFGGTGDDVLLAIVTGALRAWIQSRGVDVHDMALRAAIPPAAATPDEPDSLGHVTQLLAPLPVHVADPVERLRVLQREASDPRRRAEAECIAKIGGYPRPPILGQMSRMRFSSRMYNLLVAHHAGSSLPVYLLGRRMRTLHPVAFLITDQALAIASMSYDSSVFFGLLGDYDALPDLDVLATGITDAMHDLVELASESAGAFTESGV